MHFKRLEINEWQQFQKIEINLHERLTVLTGANGCGKTTILNLFAKHAGWESPQFSTPKTDFRTGIVKFFARIFKGSDKSSTTSFGKINYSDNQESVLHIQQSAAAQYNVRMSNIRPVKCFYIPSHRPIFQYQKIDSIPTVKKDKNNAFQEVSNSAKNRYKHGYGSHSASFIMKNTLIGWAINGYGVSNGSKSIMSSDSEQVQFYEGFQETLKKILPPTIGFQGFEIRNMEIVFVCNNGLDEFLLETASGGISALIDIAWQIYMFRQSEYQEFTVIIDEIENHLHPTMQRRILPDLLNAFPKARFIVSTHSPLVVGSSKNSNVYALKYNNENKVVSEELDFNNEAKTASQILDEVLGVSFTMPIWVEEELKRIIEKYSKLNLTNEDFSRLRTELSNSGLENMAPFTIQGVLEKKND